MVADNKAPVVVSSADERTAADEDTRPARPRGFDQLQLQLPADLGADTGRSDDDTVMTIVLDTPSVDMSPSPPPTDFKSDVASDRGTASNSSTDSISESSSPLSSPVPGPPTDSEEESDKVPEIDLSQQPRPGRIPPSNTTAALAPLAGAASGQRRAQSEWGVCTKQVCRANIVVCPALPHVRSRTFTAWQSPNKKVSTLHAIADVTSSPRTATLCFACTSPSASRSGQTRAHEPRLGSRHHSPRSAAMQTTALPVPRPAQTSTPCQLLQWFLRAAQTPPLMHPQQR